MAKPAYDPAFRRSACALARKIGRGNAAAELGVNDGTLGAWLSREADGRAAEVVMSDVDLPNRDMSGGVWLNGRPVIAEPIAATWDERAPVVADLAGSLSELSLATAQAYMRVGRTNDALNAVKVSDIATKQAQLLTGGATMRTEGASTMTLPEALKVLADHVRQVRDKETQSVSFRPSRGLVLPADLASDLPSLPQNHQADHHG